MFAWPGMADERPRPPRLYIPLAIKREAARRQNGVCPCGCGTPVWKDAKETKPNLQLDHDPALRLRDVNEEWTDYIPAQLDPAYLVWRCADSHGAKTRGRGATTAGTDAGKIKKERWREKDAAGVSKPKRAWGSRAFQKVKTRWPKRSMRGR